MSRDPIVVGTDGEPRAELAVDKAGELARALGAPVHVVCVASAIYGKDWPAAITAERVVDAAADRLRSRGITVQTHVSKGHMGEAALELVAVAGEEHAQMIVVGNKGMTGIGRLLGSVPNRVSHLARCDVLIVPTQSRALPEFGGGSIVVGTDGSPRATRAVNKAIRLAKALDGKLHIVSSSKSVDSAKAAVATAAAEAADQGVTSIKYALRDDHPADLLLAAARISDAAIMVVGSKGMHGDERERFGNIPDKLSHKRTTSVLIAFTGDASDTAGDAMSGVAEVTT
ncbi:MAG: universal stress protein [Solirubrobacteraceae bacterium]